MLIFGVFETIFHHKNVFGSFENELWGRGQLIDFNLRARCLLTHIKRRYQLTCWTWNHSSISSNFFATQVFSGDVQQAVSSLH